MEKRWNSTLCRSLAAVVVGLPTLTAGVWVLVRPSTPDATAAQGRKSTVVSTVSSNQGANAAAKAFHPPEQFVGAGGCAAVNCHGGNPKPSASSSNAYSIWATEDPHRNSFLVLKKALSKQMLWRIDGAKRDDPKAPADEPWADKKPHEDDRCLVCHSIKPPELPGKSIAHLLADGVSCEACHGPARNWRIEHTSTDWRDRDAAKRYQPIDACSESPVGNKAKPPMWNTKNIVSLANICVRCHVGGPGRDVNHDLIAAGHPRLNFEYAAFMRHLPKHWNDDLDREKLESKPRQPQPKRGDYELRLWTVGQVVSARAAAALLSQRANQAVAVGRTSQANSDGPRAPAGLIAAAWPEFSEYDCFACHHQLGEPSWRQSLVYGKRPQNRPNTEPHRRLGEMPWGSWYFSTVQHSLLAEFDSSGLSMQDLTGDLRTAAESPPPQAGGIINTADTLAGDLGRKADAMVKLKFDGATIARALRAVRELPPLESWDEATQRYLALVALTTNQQTSATKERLREIRNELSFEKGFDSPKHFSMDKVKSLRERFDQLMPLLTD